MAKLGAYPLIIASIFFNFTANSAEDLGKDGAIFSKDTSSNDGVQHLSSMMDVDVTPIDDVTIMSPSLTPPRTPKKRLRTMLSGMSEEDIIADISTEILTKYIELSEHEKGPCLDAIRELFNHYTPNNVINLIQDITLDFTQAAAKHREQWIKNNTINHPQDKGAWLRSFMEAFEKGTYRCAVFDPISGNTHFYLKGNTPQKHTPRRKDNIARLAQGKPPIYVDPTTNEIVKCHMHHIGQDNQTVVVQVPASLHRHASMHDDTIDESRIARPLFQSEKRRSNQGAAEIYKQIRE